MILYIVIYLIVAVLIPAITAKYIIKEDIDRNGVTVNNLILFIFLSLTGAVTFLFISITFVWCIFDGGDWLLSKWNKLGNLQLIKPKK
jgi:hypothetical protein